MHPKEVVTIKRTCDATEIPSGRKMSLFGGTELFILQSLGGSFTVMTHQGQMASVAGRDADALGKEIPPPPQVTEGPGQSSVEKQVWAHLKTCYDPEIPHNIVDLGLVYGCAISQIEETDEAIRVDIKMTLTAPGCGMGEWLRQEVKSKLLTIPTVKQVNVDVVFDPPWDKGKMHPALRRELGYA